MASVVVVVVMGNGISLGVVVKLTGAMEVSAVPPSSELETIIALFGYTSALCNSIVGAGVLLLPALLPLKLQLQFCTHFCFYNEEYGLRIFFY